MRTPPSMAGSALVPVKIRREECPAEDTELSSSEAISLVTVRSLELPAPLALQEELVACAAAMETLSLPPEDHPRLRHDSYSISIEVEPVGIYNSLQVVWKENFEGSVREVQDSEPQGEGEQNWDFLGKKEEEYDSDEEDHEWDSGTDDPEYDEEGDDSELEEFEFASPENALKRSAESEAHLEPDKKKVKMDWEDSGEEGDVESEYEFDDDVVYEY